LWDLFEQMTQELGCSMDYLINESMRHYARSRDYAPGEPGQMPQQNGGAARPMGNPSNGNPSNGNPSNNWGHQGGAMDHRTFQRVPAVQGGQPQSFGQPQYGQAPQAQPRSPGGPPPPPPRPGQQTFQQPQAQQSPRGGFGQQRQHSQQQPAAPQHAAPQQQRGPLYLIFNNNRYLVDNDKFIVGRGSQQTDLTIRDGNISRQHCAVIHRNGNYYIKDLGSTNGIEYRGNRIESKRIEDGDVFFLCDYELRFTYQG
jgi:hypothetical protein